MRNNILPYYSCQITPSLAMRYATENWCIRTETHAWNRNLRKDKRTVRQPQRLKNNKLLIACITCYFIGRGNCTEMATCDCDPGWTGSNCGLPTCSNVSDCSLHGRCIAPDTCRCYVGYTGLDCASEILCPSVGNCSNNGLCVNDMECQCFYGFTGISCETAICIGDCNGRGRCVSADLCSCDDGWIGANCSQPSCESVKFCSGEDTVCSTIISVSTGVQTLFTARARLMHWCGYLSV